jgi:hypothetical protein
MTKSMPGYVGRGDELVNFDPRFRSIIEWLLLRVVVFDTIDNASAAAKKIRYRVKLVTLDGQVINAGGAFTGGSAKRDSGLLSRMSEIAALREQAEKYNRTIAEKKNIITYKESIRTNSIFHGGIGMESSKSLSFASYKRAFAIKMPRTTPIAVAIVPIIAKYTQAIPAERSGPHSKSAICQYKNPILPTA